jgi:prepilin-type N-terminal cleavage/methylation domain-containing protein
MSRRAVSLIEMLVVISVSAVLMGVATTMLFTLMQATRNGSNHVSQAATVARLADQFRSDVHAALPSVATDAPAKDQWQFALATDTAVIYKALPGEIQRHEQVAGKLIRQESYLLPADTTAEIAIRADAAPPMASLIVSPSGPNAPAGREIRVDAALGIDHRFIRPLDEKEKPLDEKEKPAAGENKPAEEKP